LRSQDAEEALRVGLWYAQRVIAQTAGRRPVVFVIADRPTGQAQSDPAGPDWATTFRRAGLTVTGAPRPPRGDTLVIEFARPSRDSVTAAGRFYTLATQQASCGPDGGGTGLHVAYVICDTRACRLDHETTGGVSLRCEPPH
jgi:hypothetical protein